MKRSIVTASVSLVFVAVFVLTPLAACVSKNFLLNQTAERAGNNAFQFINNTGYRASFSFGTFDALDKGPGTVAFEQLRLEAHTTSEVSELFCQRNAVVGTEEFLRRVLATDGDQGDDFDADAFTAVVSFSSATADSAAAALPDVGTAAGVEMLLGVDFSCGDLLIFTFEEDPDAPGGFRIDFSVIQGDVQS